MERKFFKQVSLFLAIISFASWSVISASTLVKETSESGHTADYATSQKSTEGERWDLTRINAAGAWQVISGGAKVIVAVLDTGIDETHSDLTGKVVGRVNFSRSPTLDDLNGHGTHIAGIIAANINKANGITGLAYNSYLMNVKVAHDDGSCEAKDVAKGIIWAADNGANIINVSLVFRKPSLVLEEAVNYAWGKGCVIIAAAGNNYSSSPTYPAAYQKVIAVAASDTSDRLTSWSNHGDWINVAAPGLDIYSTLPGGNYAFRNGTSSAAALVAGEAALLFSTATDGSGDGRVNDEVRKAIEYACDNAGNIDNMGQGRINALKAAKAIDSASTPKP